MSSFSSIFFLFVITTNLLACTSGSNNGADEQGLSSSVTARQLTLEKVSGINMGESTGIWGAGMLDGYLDNGALKQNVKINYLSLDPLKSFPKTVWDWSVPSELVGSASFSKGIRTFVSEWGLLMGKTGDIHAGLYLAELSTRSVKKIFATMDPGYYPLASGGMRSAPFSYKVGDNKFIALIYRRSSSYSSAVSTDTYRIERFWYKNGNFVRVRPYDFPNTQGLQDNDVYSSFLDACSTKARSGGNCAPRLHFTCNGCTRSKVQAVDLTADANPPTLYTVSSSPVTPTEVVAPNKNFDSVSHPTSGTYNGMELGSINDKVYSMAGDPDEGNIFRTNRDGGGSLSHVAYDRLNGIVYRIDRTSNLLPDGHAGSAGGPVISIFKKECFISRTNCDPTVVGSAAGSKIFRDGGSDSLGPASDLGDGCVAIMGLYKPSSAEKGKYPGVYKACTRDKDDLSKGISMMKIGEFEGFLYMYNDFTASQLYDLDVNIEYDFAAERFSPSKSLKFLWEPRSGFSAASIVDLELKYRCFAKTSPPAGDAGFVVWNLADIGAAYKTTLIPNCNGNVVQFRMKKAGPHYTRFRSLKVTIRE